MRPAWRQWAKRVREILKRANGIFTMTRFACAIMGPDLLHGLRYETRRRLRASPDCRARMIVFDSGLGGLTVLDEIVNAAPSADILYVADDAAFPYGRLAERALVARVLDVMERLVERHEPDAVVIACNTASTLVLAPLRERFPAIAIIGTVPAVKPAAQASRSGIISVLATPGTVARDYTRRLVDEYARHCDVTLVGARELAGLAERAMRGLPVDDDAIRAEIAPCFVARGEARTDAVVLACTHYPLLKAEFRRLAPWPVAWIDPAPAIARRVADVLGLNGPEPSPERRRLFALFTSGGAPEPALARALAVRGLIAGSFAAIPLRSDACS